MIAIKCAYLKKKNIISKPPENWNKPTEMIEHCCLINDMCLKLWFVINSFIFLELSFHDYILLKR